VGQNAGSNYNSVLIDGTGSQWLAGGSCTMRFGYLGNHNTMTISNGGYLYNGFQSTLGGTGGATGGDNSVTITDPGSQWRTDSWLAIGRNSQNNALLIKNGGTLTAAGANTMGNSGGTNNTATVTGAGSVWNANGGVGLNSSTNTVYISSGGLLDTTSVSGGTFNLGDGNLGTGGVYSTVKANNLATTFLNFNKGVLLAKQNNAALITGTVTLNGPAYIDTASYADTIAVAMGGIGSLYKEGTGTLTLTQLNTYGGRHGRRLGYSQH
jgi:T5SS/PEP-CTERM-associated repeat protein